MPSTKRSTPWHRRPSDDREDSQPAPDGSIRLSPWAVDITGQVFGQLTVIEPIGISHGQMRWRCRCSCGTIVEHLGGNLRSGASTRCRDCFAKSVSLAKTVDLSGRTFGRWVVLRKSERMTNKQFCYWSCRCGTCGIISDVAATNLLSSRSQGCRKCQGVRSRLPVSIGDRFGLFEIVEGPIRVRRKMHYRCRCACGATRVIGATELVSGARTRCKQCELIEKNGPWNGKYARIKAAAESRDLQFDVTMDFIVRLFEEQGGFCKLSGLPIKIARTHRLVKDETASLDRIDSTKGYTPDNVQWVHKHINKMKQNFTDEEFVRLCQQVASHFARMRRRKDRDTLESGLRQLSPIPD